MEINVKLKIDNDMFNEFVEKCYDVYGETIDNSNLEEAFKIGYKEYVEETIDNAILEEDAMKHIFRSARHLYLDIYNY